MIGSIKFCRLTRRSKNGAPPAARGVEAFRMRSKEFDRNVNEALVYKTNNNASLACHRRVNRVTREQIAEQRILAVGWPASNLIARIEITNHDRDAFGFEI
jgi:hypothetical protein